MVVDLLVAHLFQTRIPQSVVDLVLFGIAPAQSDTSSALLTGPPKRTAISIETSRN